jgi:V/A-type H+-transporting ATPase subunit D
MTTVRVPPGRAGRLWLHRRLSTARRGSDLLERKLRILLSNLERRREREKETGAAWRDRVATAETWLLRASLISGERAIGLASLPGSASVTVAWTSTMGVRYPSGAAYDIPPRRPVDAAPGGAAVVLAQREYVRAAEAAADHAAARTALIRISTEITTTRQRVRALQRRWIPALERALAHTELELEELELAEEVRRRRALSTQDGGRAGVETDRPAAGPDGPGVPGRCPLPASHPGGPL